jgi:hypothetical protein
MFLVRQSEKRSDEAIQRFPDPDCFAPLAMMANG